MTEYKFRLAISAQDYLHFYSGVAKYIQVRSFCGKEIRFPAEKLRRFVLQDGIHGIFVIRLDKNNKFHSINKLD